MAYDLQTTIAALEEKVAVEGPCPMCGIGDAWKVVEGAVFLPLTADSETVDAEEGTVDPGRRIEMAGAAFQPVACGHCGFTRFFHLDTLLIR